MFENNELARSRPSLVVCHSRTPGDVLNVYQTRSTTTSENLCDANNVALCKQLNEESFPTELCGAPLERREHVG